LSGKNKRCMALTAYFYVGKVLIILMLYFYLTKKKASLFEMLFLKYDVFSAYLIMIFLERDPVVVLIFTI
jgi:hypothetical protein